ncbi:DNA polymerase alpha/epsilon subunit B-domain-containing protein [Crassisporium funariophilum]|nr:DNA polymerase alpha/epsilon subunit B-domain-containing protein [Crassisporium funariophilum]
MATLGQDITRLLTEKGAILDDKLLAECVSVCQMYNLDPDGLYYKLEAINYKASTTSSGFSPITIDTISAVKSRLQKDLANESTGRAQPKNKGLTTAQVDRSRMPSHMVRNLATASGSAAMRMKQEHAGESSMAGSGSSSSTGNVALVGPPSDLESKKKRAYRYMYEKISERSEALDQIIDDFVELLRAHYDISEFGDPSASTDEEVTIVGRIAHDADAESISKLAEGAITIESSRMLSSGARAAVRLDPALKIRGGVRGVGEVGLYPGAIVALKGKNGGGGYFLATEILAIPPLKPSPAAQGIINPKLDPSTSHTSANMLVACGPYTMDTDLSYKPWRALLQTIKASKPDVLLLVGPFVDSAHPKIKTGEIDVTPANLFRAHFVDPLRNFLTASPGSIVLLVPSVRDLVSNHAAFPQPELNAELFNFNPRIHLLPNPARFMINDIAFAISSVDTLFHLRKELYFKRGVDVEPLPLGPDDLPNDAMANLSRHLLQQRSFYPIFPVPQDLSHEVNLDVTHSDGLRMVDEGDLDYAPDVMILPSRLKQFSKHFKVVHSTHTINPSFLSKGTYGTVSLAPRSIGTPKDRLKIEIIKLEAPPPPVT